MLTIPQLLAALGLILIACAKPAHSNDVSESLCGVLESSEMHPVKSVMTFPILEVTRPWVAPVSVLLDADLAAGPLSSLNTTRYVWEQSQGGMKETSTGVNPPLHVCLATQVFVNTLSMALQSLLIFLLQGEAHVGAEATPRTTDPLWPIEFWKC